MDFSRSDVSIRSHGATLVYDHFGFGASDGEPRQDPAAGIQREGYRDAIAWLAEQPGIDPARIGIWGTSYSGGRVIVLAASCGAALGWFRRHLLTPETEGTHDDGGA